MPDLDEQLREFIDAGSPPVRIDEVVGDKAKGIEPPRVAHRSRRRWLGLVGSAAVVTAAAVLIGVLLAPAADLVRPPTASAATVLAKAAKVAGAQTPLVPGPGQFLYVQTLFGTSMSSSGIRYYENEIHQVWSSPTAQTSSTWTFVGGPVLITPADRAAWIANGSPALGSGGAATPTTPYYDVANLPTNPSAMPAYFAEQPGIYMDPRFGRDATWHFNTAIAFLQAGASAQQRSALLRYIATIPGVQYEGTARTIGTRETGSLLAIGSEGRGIVEQAIVDPTTSAVLEVRIIVIGPNFTTFTQPISLLGKKPATQYTDFIYNGISSSATSPPAGAPSLPHAAPTGQTQPPAPGTAYP